MTHLKFSFLHLSSSITDLSCSLPRSCWHGARSAILLRRESRIIQGSNSGTDQVNVYNMGLPGHNIYRHRPKRGKDSRKKITESNDINYLPLLMYLFLRRGPFLRDKECTKSPEFSTPPIHQLAYC
jgi:hypothetical protein